MAKGDINIPPDMHDAITDCKKQCDVHIEKFTSKLDAAPDIVYHYTDNKGLLGILKSGKIWLTDIFGLNDPSEIRHGVNHACEILAAEAEHPVAKHFSDLFDKFNSNKIEEAAHFFVACFSKTHKDLGQWRAYGDNGRGFTIGFDGKLLEDTFVKQGDERIPGNGTFPVTYDDDRLCEILKNIVGEVLPQIEMPTGKELNNETINDFLRRLYIHLSTSTIQAAALFKHEAYVNEEEYRFLQLRSIDDPIDDLRYRVRNNSVIRFTDFDWNTKGQDVLREIVIGPAADENSARLSAKNCLLAGRFDPDRVKIYKSKIPYRGT